MVLEHRRHDRQARLAAAPHHEDVVARHLARDRAALGAEVGHQLGERARIQHQSREPVRTDARRLLEHRDRDLGDRGSGSARGDALVVALDQIREMDGPGQTRGPRAHELHVELEDFALHLHPGLDVGV